MKRTLSGNLAGNPTQKNSGTGTVDDNEKNNQQDTEASNDGAPAMHGPNANAVARNNPALAFDQEYELPDWEEFAQMLPHAPPVESRRNASVEEHPSASDDERSTEEFSSEESSSSSFDETIATKIFEGLAPGEKMIKIEKSSARQLREILEVCKQQAQITSLDIDRSESSSGFTVEIQEALTDFFKTQHTIESLWLMSGVSSPNSIISAVTNFTAPEYCANKYIYPKS